NDPLLVDINRREPEVVTAFLSGKNLHPLAVEACLEIAPKSRIVAYGQALFIGLPIQVNWDDSAQTNLSILCLPGMLITLHESTIPAIENLVNKDISDMRFHRQSTSAILYQILDNIIDQDMVFSIEARESIDRLEELLYQGSDPALTETVHPVKRHVAHLEAIFEDQLHCVGALQTIESDSFSIEGLQDYLRDAVSHLDHTERFIGRQAARLTAIHQQCLLQLQDGANKRLQVLTIISAVFLPLMLVTGIYGMNFLFMPELAWKYGYFSVLVVMAIIAAVLLWIFSSKGWFK
ncbi:MAG: magnesium transporter CorA family protein, partial [Desulfuromusa sp.]|nr:magnesium transporter CorA family protein [Desulfuromusa sp.]